jgi:hypothetical protein
MLVTMSLESALKRIWRTWKVGFVAAIIIYAFVFYLGYTYEVHREEEGETGERPVELFDVRLIPNLTPGARTYTVNVTNNQDYTIQEVSIEFTGEDIQGLIDLNEGYSDTIPVGGDIGYSNYVEFGATAIDIILDDNEPIQGLTNLNLYVQYENNPPGWESTGPTNHEEVHITQAQLETFANGNYIATVSHESGFRAVSYTLTYRVTYGPLKLHQTSNVPISPGAGQDFKFTFNLDQAQIEEMVCNVIGMVEMPDGLLLRVEMTFDSNWNLVEESRPIPEEVSGIIPWGPVDMTGTSSAIMYLITVLAGIVFYLRARIKSVFMPQRIRRAHCFISLVTLMLVFAHMSVAMQKDWPWESPGMRFAQLATVGLLSFTIFGFFDVEIIKALGKSKWRLIHIIFTLMLAWFITFHFGFMGDHLGWLKGAF